MSWINAAKIYSRVCFTIHKHSTDKGFYFKPLQFKASRLDWESRSRTGASSTIFISCIRCENKPTYKPQTADCVYHVKMFYVLSTFAQPGLWMVHNIIASLSCGFIIMNTHMSPKLNSIVINSGCLKTTWVDQVLNVNLAHGFLLSFYFYG